jgi:hypothetical protein
VAGIFLIDSQSTRYEEVQAAVSQDISNIRIRYPWVFGDILEAAYIEAFGREPKDFLMHEETLLVIARLPQGVFQVADITVGPFGMIRVVQQRCMPPSLCGPEILCFDPGCAGVHHVMFKTGKTDAGSAYVSIDRSPQPEEMKKLLGDLLRPDEQYYRPDNDWGLPWLLMSGVTPEETRRLLAKLLANNTDGIRAFANAHLSNPLPNLSANEIAQKIGDAQVCQMLLTATNESLVNALEEMIEDGEIEIGRTETRGPIRSRHAEGGSFRSAPQVSRLGVRFLPEVRIAPLRLRSFVMQLYKGDEEKELAWLLRAQPGVTNVAKLNSYLLSESPDQVISKLVMGSRERVLDAFHLLRYGHFELPSNPESDKGLIEKVLWKLGGDLPAPPSPESRVIERIKIFRRVSEVERSRSEEGIDAIRSAGINMFVAFEALLADVVDYVCWVFFSDHYSENRRMRFVYRQRMARDFSRPLLASRSRSGFEFDASGNNSLGTLIAALKEIAAIGDESLASPASFVRSEDGSPFEVAYSGIYEFPFTHTKLILDVEPESALHALNDLRNAASELDGAAVTKVRNGMGHPRSSFPGDEDVVKSCLGIERALAVLQALGALPTIYVRAGRSIDSFGRILTTMTDGGGKSVVLHGPFEVAGSGMPRPTVPQLIFTSLQLAHSSQPLRLSYIEETGFTKLLDAHAPLRPGGSIAEPDTTIPDANKSNGDGY